jgi:sensor c-di-GMP phosphodiesterase-like protein
MFHYLRGFGVTLAAAVGAVAAGLYFGAMAVREITVLTAETQLERYAARLVADDEAYSAELSTILTAVDASQTPACSEAELAYFRRVLGSSELVKDVGRLKDGSIQCSADLGAGPAPILLGTTDFHRRNGVEIYRHLPPSVSRTPNALLLVRGGTFVVFAPEARLHLEQPPMHFAVSTLNALSGKRNLLLGEEPELKPEQLAQPGRLRNGDHLYATSCSSRITDCVTTSTSVQELIAANRNGYDAGIALSGVLCGMIGFVFFSFYANNKRLDQQLRRAIRDGRVHVAYQPIVELGSGRITGAEALARWTDESEAGVPPEVFVRIAEEKGFIGDLTRLVVHRVLRDFGEVLRYRTDFHVSINVTAGDLIDPNFLPMLSKALAAARVEPERISIEITESSTVRNKQSMEAIRILRQMGHSVHIDDFGTGYSSLAYLQDLAVDALKIDKVFTQSIGTESVTSSILPQILAMARALNLAVVVEGVETLEQAEYFHSANLPVYLQGWYYGKPQPFWQLLGLMSGGPQTTRSGRGSRPQPVSAA